MARFFDPRISSLIIRLMLTTFNDVADDPGIQELVRINADLSRISINDIPVESGADGQAYYVVDFSIEVTFYSAYTTYELIYQDRSYGLVTAEYV